MFEFMVFVLVMAFYLSLFVACLMLVSRIYIALTTKGSIKEKVLIAVLPLGIGVFMYVKNERWLRIYKIMIIVLLVLSVFASLFLFHRELGL